MDSIHETNNLRNMHQELFYVLFEKVVNTYCSIIPTCCRKPLEYLSLISALVLLSILIYIHLIFIREPVNCLSHVSNDWPRDGILRVEFNPLHIDSECYNAYRKCYKNTSLLLNSEGNPLFSHRRAHLNKTLSYEFPKKNVNGELFAIENVPYVLQNFEPVFNSPLVTSFEEENNSSSVYSHEKYVIEYTLIYGLLKLPSAIRKKLHVPVLTVKLNLHSSSCFGNGFSRFLLKYVIGFSDVLMTSLKNLVEKDESKGFIRNIITGDQYRFVNKTFTLSSYAITASAMLLFTLSISMLLRYSHHQIFLFVVRMLQALEFSSNASFPVASLITVVFALVGMEAIMSDFFNNNTTAFYVILIVWIADQYDTICCHHVITKRHWLKFFYLYHFAFYIYDFRFNGQYSGLALLTSWMFIQHSMVFFFHRFELPYTLSDHGISLNDSSENSNNSYLFRRQQIRLYERIRT